MEGYLWCIFTDTCRVCKDSGCEFYGGRFAWCGLQTITFQHAVMNSENYENNSQVWSGCEQEHIESTILASWIHAASAYRIPFINLALQVAYIWAPRTGPVAPATAGPIFLLMHLTLSWKPITGSIEDMLTCQFLVILAMHWRGKGLNHHCGTLTISHAS